MAFDITGITNENEFYTHHYLSAILENDLKDLFKEWNRKADEEDIPQPYKKIRSLRKEYFALQDALQRERNIEDRLALQRDFQAQLLSALGYEPYFTLVLLDDGISIPLIGGINKPDGSPELWILEAADVFGEEHDPLEMQLVNEQYPDDNEIQKVLDSPLEEIITRRIFGHSEPPRWVILLNSTQLLLLDRTKWHEKRLLRFNIREILDRRETTTLQAMAALLHRDSICPKDGMPLLDTLDENSHKHAFAVSEDLKYSLRKAIELLGNEAVWFLREKAHEKIYGRDMAGQLTRECLRYMYRMLFLFYIEARPELEYLPDKKSKEYHKGYSLESLRELEMVQLTTDESKNGFYFHESISLLFNLLYNGFQPEQADMFATPDHHTFRIAPLRSHLFNPEQTPFLNRVKFRNFVMQEIIELMSLSRPKKGKKNRRGRISYAQLGINQLGAVYEALLSYQGFFAETDLYEVKKAGEKHNVLETAYFVKPEDIEQYTEDERVFNDDGTLVKYEKGTFIYRLAGRDREKSASYYTPEVLTQCLVKYALKELLKDKTADEILELTVCEPAMGSAAFLNEAVNQLAKAYLDRKQKELDQIISHEDYPKELQKVKMYIADRNVYGVDLNPVAVELAEVSLWLNTIYEGGFVPWFGMQLVCGNSLIGARRQVFKSSLLKKTEKNDPLWLDEVPERVMPGDRRPENTVYHFLLPDRGMANYKDKVIKEMAEAEIKTINDWRMEFTKPFSKSEIEQLEKLSKAVDKLLESHTRMQGDIDRRTTDTLSVFGQKRSDKTPKLTTTEHKDLILRQELYSRNVRNSSPYRRLKLVMDYWCALWFWPIEKADLLPSRAEYLLDLTLLLEGNLYDADQAGKGGQMRLFPDTTPKQLSLDMVDEFGFVDVDRLSRDNNRFASIQELADRFRYLHWELEFCDLFQSRGGFDLVLGNPPWIKVTLEEVAFFASFDPLITLRNLQREDYQEYLRIRDRSVRNKSIRTSFLSECVRTSGISNSLSSRIGFQTLQGVQPNLYKCFLVMASYVAGKNGAAGFLHDKGAYDDAKGAILRIFLYQRLCYYFRFYNQLHYFPEEALGHAGEFCLSIYRSQPKKDNIEFRFIANILSEKTIDAAFEDKFPNKIFSMKDDKGGWEIRGNFDRIVTVNEEFLRVCAEVIEADPESWRHTKLALLHSASLSTATKKIGRYPIKLKELSSKIVPSQMLHEKGAVQKGYMRKNVSYPPDIMRTIFSGPHYYVLNPLMKTPNSGCKSKGDYSVLDLESIPFDYMPRTLFKLREQSRLKVIRGLPRLKSKPISEYAKFTCRTMAQRSNERTLIPTLLPPGALHTHGSYSLINSDSRFCALLAGSAGTLPFDFIVRLSGRTNMYFETLKMLPVLSDYRSQIIIRALRLTCLTKYYSELWHQCWADSFRSDDWLSDGLNPRLRINTIPYAELSSTLSKSSAFRIPYQRRQASVELDVIVAKALAMTCKELISILKTEFYKLYEYERTTWYDLNGRIVYTQNRGLPKIGFPNRANKNEAICWEDIKNMRSGTVERTIMDDTMPGGPIERTITYEAPFDRCDREKDYETAWAEFTRRFAK